MPWIVKLDKESDWIGRYSIEWYKRRGNRHVAGRLRGRRTATVPIEGAQVVGADGAAGRAHHQRRASRAGSARRSGSPGCRSSSSEEGTADHASPTRPARRSRPPSRTRPSTTPMERGCAREHSAIRSHSCRRPPPPRASSLRTPMERNHLAAGASIEEHDGWRVAVYAPNGDAGRLGGRRLATSASSTCAAPAAEIDGLSGRRSSSGRRQPRRRRLDAAAVADARRRAVPVPARRPRSRSARSAPRATDITCGWAGGRCSAASACRDVFIALVGAGRARVALRPRRAAWPAR